MRKIFNVSSIEQVYLVKQKMIREGFELYSCSHINDNYVLDFKDTKHATINNFKLTIFVLSIIGIIGFGGLLFSLIILFLIYKFLISSWTMMIFAIISSLLGVINVIESIIGLVEYKKNNMKFYLPLGIVSIISLNLFFGVVLIAASKVKNTIRSV